MWIMKIQKLASYREQGKYFSDRKKIQEETWNKKVYSLIEEIGSWWNFVNFFSFGETFEKRDVWITLQERRAMGFLSLSVLFQQLYINGGLCCIEMGSLLCFLQRKGRRWAGRVETWKAEKARERGADISSSFFTLFTISLFLYSYCFFFFTCFLE